MGVSHGARFLPICCFPKWCFVPRGAGDECVAIKLDIKHVKWNLTHK